MADRPGSLAQLSFERDVRPLFREKDRDAMRKAFDLWSLSDVGHHQGAIVEQVRSGGHALRQPLASGAGSYFGTLDRRRGAALSPASRTPARRFWRQDGGRLVTADADRPDPPLRQPPPARFPDGLFVEMGTVSGTARTEPETSRPPGPAGPPASRPAKPCRLPASAWPGSHFPEGYGTCPCIVCSRAGQDPCLVAEQEGNVHVQRGPEYPPF